MNYKEMMVSKIKELFVKYDIGNIEALSFKNFPNNILITVAGKTYDFFSDFSVNKYDEKGCQNNKINIPILCWRHERKYIEMKNALKNGTVKNPVGMRVKSIHNNNVNMKDILLKEIDIAEWILDDCIISAYANANNDNSYFNVILSTKKNIKISLEIGKAQIKEAIILHEIIAEKGILSDIPVDTQINHYPIYVFQDNFVETYNDIDFELYGMQYKDVAKLRFILCFYQNNFAEKEINKTYKRHCLVIDSIFQSEQNNKKVYIESN